MPMRGRECHHGLVTRGLTARRHLRLRDRSARSWQPRLANRFGAEQGSLSGNGASLALGAAIRPSRRAFGATERPNGCPIRRRIMRLERGPQARSSRNGPRNPWPAARRRQTGVRVSRLRSSHRRPGDTWIGANNNMGVKFADAGQDDPTECRVAIAPMTLHKGSAQQSIIEYA
jgi:hypothetical protein